MQNVTSWASGSTCKCTPRNNYSIFPNQLDSRISLWTTEQPAHARPAAEWGRRMGKRHYITYNFSPRPKKEDLLGFELPTSVTGESCITWTTGPRRFHTRAKLGSISREFGQIFTTSPARMCVQYFWGCPHFSYLSRRFYIFSQIAPTFYFLFFFLASPELFRVLII